MSCSTLYLAHIHEHKTISRVCVPCLSDDLLQMKYPYTGTQCRKASLDNRTLAGETALFLAASDGNLDIVRKLLDAGARADIPNNEGVLPVKQAALNDHYQFVMMNE